MARKGWPSVEAQSWHRRSEIYALHSHDKRSSTVFNLLSVVFISCAQVLSADCRTFGGCCVAETFCFYVLLQLRVRRVAVSPMPVSQKSCNCILWSASVGCSRVCLLRVVPIDVTNCAPGCVFGSCTDRIGACAVPLIVYISSGVLAYDLAVSHTSCTHWSCIAGCFYVHVCLNKRIMASPFGVSFASLAMNREE